MPLLTKEQFQALGARLMQPRKKHADGTVETCEDVAAEFGITVSTLRRARKRFADHMRMQGKPTRRRELRAFLQG